MSGAAFTYQGHSEVTPTGTIVAYAGSTAPDGWLLCDGSSYSLPSALYSNLFTLIGTTYGGTQTNGIGNFQVPNLKGKFIIGAGTGYTLNSTGGNAGGNLTLTTANLPAHSHSITDPGHYHWLPSGHSGGSYENWGMVTAGSSIGWQVEPPTLPANANPDPAYTSGSATNITGTNNTGSGTAVSIMPPYISLNYIIKY